MFDSITATSVVAAATSWVTTSGFMAPVLIALGLAVVLGLASWVFVKIRSARSGGRRRGKK